MKLVGKVDSPIVPIEFCISTTNNDVADYVVTAIVDEETKGIRILEVWDSVNQDYLHYKSKMHAKLIDFVKEHITLEK
jgi:hypothetical protein